MSHGTISCMSSPVSVLGVESIISDGESTLSLGDNKDGACIDDEGPRPTTKDKLREHASMSAQSTGRGLFRSGDGDIFLLVNDTVLETHKHVLRRFSKLDSMITDESTHIPLSLRRDESGVEDFQNTFKILYASSVVEGPFDFDSPTLTSALRIATAYGYPGLRSFAIEKLENASLSAVERIRLAREFDLASWEAPAFAELCERDEAITRAEAAVLGFDTFVDLAAIREKEQRRRGREIDAAAREGFGSPEQQDSNDTDGTSVPARTGSFPSANQSPPDAKPELNAEKQSSTNGANSDVDKETSVGGMKPSFVDTPLPGLYGRTKLGTHAVQIEVPDCDCVYASGSYHTKVPCRLAPCAIAAFKHLQAQQLVHSNQFAKLESGALAVSDHLTELDNSMESRCRNFY